MEGRVESFGPKRIDGWVAWTPDTGREVIFRLNGVEVSTTVACKPVTIDGVVKDFGFARFLGDLWNYLGEGDVVSVEYDGTALPIQGHGLAYVHPSGTISKSADLLDRITAGQIFDKKGRLAQALSGQTKWDEQFFAKFNVLEAQLRERFGIVLFPMYGTLLGTVREGDFIAHDNDVDYTYISKHVDPTKVKAEFVAICEYLIDNGYRGYLSRYTFNVKAPLKFDIYYSWFNEANHYQVSFGYHGEEAQKSDEFFKFQPRFLGRHTVQVPLSAERILHQVYGPNWRVPDPGFSHYSRTRKLSAPYVLSYEQLQPLYWKQFYKRRPTAEPSAFAQAMLSRLRPNSLVLDLGCGSGRDAVFFAEHGHSVIGLDLCDVAIERGRRVVRKKRLRNCRLVRADVSDRHAMRTIVRKFIRSPPATHDVVVYARFFMHSVTATTEQATLRLLKKYLGTFSLMAEFRTTLDEKLPKAHAAHYVRYIDPSAFVAKLKRYGMKVEHREEGTGLAVYKTEDPHLCRIVGTVKATK